MTSLKIYTDGGSRNNPGRAAIAGIIKNDRGLTIARFSETIGVATNSEAEYLALIKGLYLVSAFKPDRVACHSDSEFMIKQMRSEYKVKNPRMKELFNKACIEEADCGKVEYVHCRREHPIISECDSMLNVELDKVNERA